MTPLISVCIPAYKRTDYLARLLDSLAAQTFTGFEVVLSDDSNDTSVAELAGRYHHLFPVVYRKNTPALGTPANWNQAIRLATGEWIKLMHDDDWLAAPDALQQFADKTGTGKKFIFSAYRTCQLSSGKETAMPLLSAKQLARLQRHPHTLLASNRIGPPSVTMIHRSVQEVYDERMKWMVDFDFYIRVLQQHAAEYIPLPLVKIGMSDEQVTASSFLNPAVELPEAWLFLEKYGTAPARNIWVYDAWWRLMRNLHIRQAEQLTRYTPGKTWPALVLRLLQHQSRVPAAWLKQGVVSKTAMALSYLCNKPEA